LEKRREKKVSSKEADCKLNFSGFLIVIIMKKAIIFDLDGTLTDTLVDLTNSVNFAMDRLNLNTYSTKEVEKMIGNGVSTLMKRALKEKNAHLHAEALRLQREFYAMHGADNTKPFDGVLPMLRELKNRGFFIIVHTNKDENAAKSLCDKLLNGIADVVCGTVDDSQTKPNAERLLKLLGSENIARAVYCGDSEVDIQTAKNANLPCVSVTWGFRDKDFLLAHGATNLAETPEKVVEFAEKQLL